MAFSSRGAFWAEYCGRRPKPSPRSPPTSIPDLTTRQRVTLQTKPESCQSCHGMINPLGFTLEHFDAVGRYRKEEKGRPIDATGIYETRDGRAGASSRGSENSRRSWPAAKRRTPPSSSSCSTTWSSSRSVPMVRRTLPDLRRFFAAHDFNVRKLMVEIMATSALTPTR